MTSGLANEVESEGSPALDEQAEEATAEQQGAQAEPVTPYRIVEGGRSRGSSSSARAADGNLATAWSATGRGASRRAWVWFDTGATVHVGSVRLFLTEVSAQVTITIDCSTDRDAWTTIALPAPLVAGEWQQIPVALECRYLRISFDPTGAVSALGQLAEIEILP